MKYLLNITPEELLDKKLYVDYSDKVYQFREMESNFNIKSHISNTKQYVLKYCDDEIILVFTEMSYGWELNCKITSYGTTSDKFYISGVAINFIGQMLDQKIIRFDNEIGKVY